jgi:glucan 1,3-beta-glucosidase
MVCLSQEAVRKHLPSKSSARPLQSQRRSDYYVRPYRHFFAGTLQLILDFLGVVVGAVLAVLVAGGIVVGVLISQKVIKIGSGSASAASDNGSGSGTGSGSGAGTATTTTSATTSVTTTSTTVSSIPTSTVCPTKEEIPAQVRGTYLDTSSWLDLTDFNCAYTDISVGDLPVAGLFPTWDDTKRANPNVPPLNEPWGSYTSRPIRGVNIGGWLALEPFITPSLFEYDAALGVVDEYTLCAHLGQKEAAAKLEKHYATFISEADFKAIAAAGLDHIRIPFSYWAVQVYDDPYVFRVSWKYLLRGIEWARKYGLRVKLDPHGLPGSQNGWNHSGRQGTVGWINGVNGTLNAQRSVEIHDRLSKFFAQPRYKNVVAFYGLVNEPAKSIAQGDVISWTSQVIDIIRRNGVTATAVFSEGLLGLPPWQGKLTGQGNGLALDTHNYAIFDNGLVGLKHANKVAFVCETWTAQLSASMNTATGFGPTFVGEWSQADTDCTKHLNGVGSGARWDGTFFDTIGSPKCPTLDTTCSCATANADPSTFTAEYKLFLKTFAEAQMSAFEKSWGWFYWTWKTEGASQWSYQAGLAGKYMPDLAYQRDFDCTKPVPSFGSLPEYY